jgi:hypothetical protein
MMEAVYTSETLVYLNQTTRALMVEAVRAFETLVCYNETTLRFILEGSIFMLVAVRT